MLSSLNGASEGSELFLFPSSRNPLKTKTDYKYAPSQRNVENGVETVFEVYPPPFLSESLKISTQGFWL